MLRVKRMGEVIGKHVYTSDGDYFGQIEDVNLVNNKIDGWKIKINGGFISAFGGARGVVIPHHFVKAIGDVFIVNRTSLPAKEESMEMIESPSAEGETGSSELERF